MARLLRRLAVLSLLFAVAACGARIGPAPGAAGSMASAPGEKVILPEVEWKARLTPDQYRVMRLGETEAAFSGAHWARHDHGVYRCAACGQVVFASEDKYDAGTGWPSFSRAADPDAVEAEAVFALGKARVEVRCTRCGAHLGYVYDRAPAPTYLRYSVNSVALAFEGK